MKNVKAWVAISALACGISACEVGPNYHRPQTQMPDGYDSPATAPATRPGSAAVDITQWWRSLGDAELDALVDRAVRQNLDVRIALARLQEARTSEFVVSGGVLPYMEASAGAARGTGSNSVKGRISGPLNAATNTQGLKEITDVIGFDAGWEIDLWGRFSRQLEAAHADMQAAAEARNGVLISLIADVARVYVELRTAQVRLAIAQQNLGVAGQSLNVVQQRFQRGFTNELDVALAQRQLATQQAAMVPLQEAVVEAEHRLAVLLGLSPEQLRPELEKSATLPEIPGGVVTGLPVELLRRRPDIRQAERKLAAENARIGVATADLFPRIAVTAGLGLEGQEMGRTPTVDKLIWSAGPTLMAPIMDFGRIDSMVMLENLKTQELYYGYRKTVLGAIEEVDNSVSDFDAQQQRLTQLNDAVTAGKRALQLATGQYDLGLTVFLNVLDAQRELFDLEDSYAVAQQAEIVQYIGLYKALGGGWERYQDVPPLRNPLPAVLAAGRELASKAIGDRADSYETSGAALQTTVPAAAATQPAAQ